MPNPYIKKRGSQYVIVQKGTGRVLSRHATRAKAEASFRAMEMSKHGGKFTRRKKRTRRR